MAKKESPKNPLMRKIQSKINASIALKNEELIQCGKELLSLAQRLERKMLHSMSEEQFLRHVHEFFEDVNQAWMTTVTAPDLTRV